MIRRSTWITFAIFIVLGLLTWVLLPQLKKNDETAETTPTAQPTKSLLYDITTQDVTWVKIADASGSAVEVERASASASWVLVGETEETSDNDRINAMVGVLVNLPAAKTFDTAPGLDVVGLDDPDYTITIRTYTGDEIVTKIGNLNVVGTGYYVQVGGDPVVLVSNIVLDQVLGIIKEPPLAATPTPEVTEPVQSEITVTPSP